MMFIKHEQERDFICPIKTNRKVAVSLAAKLAGHFQRVDTLDEEENATQEIYTEGVSFPLLSRQTSLHKRSWKYRHSLSRHKRYHT
ncbi:MAG: hypothetical protein MSG64_12685 [Pyrinomonadaceae bacterium MAG19_C2-C3]|nr:hypothetical protein [Pyrinomonadaceae bacterium MAG19_C2-C3]MCP9495295.1 hypothetical protein [Pyrinomonadaceae bacterium MAG19_C2-C3]